MKRGADTTLRAKRRSLGAEFRDGVTVRAAVLVIGVALLQLGFIASYVGAFGHPTPHRLPLAVVAPFSVQAKVVSELNAVAGSPLAAVAVPTVAAGRADLLHRTAYGVFVVDAVGSVDGLLEASASGVSAATAMTDVMQRVEAHVHRTVVVDDIDPRCWAITTASPRFTWSSDGSSAATWPPPCWGSARVPARPT
jgi:hypothetical protein